jgi:RNA polymerase sigma-70 factor (ECF subfamily)
MLDQLPTGYRAVFNLAVVDGYTHEEVAESLGITVGASKSNLSRARQYLRRLLRNEFEFFE